MSVVTPTILSSGQPLDPTYELISIDILREVNRIPSAHLVLINGDAARQTFRISNDAFFEPGKTIEIKARYEDKPDEELTLFQGVVIGQRVEAHLFGSSLTVELKDAAVKLTTARKNAVYRDQTDTKMISDIISGRGLALGAIASTPTTHAELVRYYCTDWDFLCARADGNGLLTVVHDGEISCLEIAVAGPTQHFFEFGISEIFNLEIDADVARQLPEVQSVGWDIKNQRLTKAAKAREFQGAQGNLNGGEIARSVGVESQTLISAVSLAPDELQSWSDATLARSRMALIRGRISVAGYGLIKLLEVMEVAGVGARFNGQTLVSGIRHRIDQDGWRTDIQFGLSAERFIEQPAVNDLPAAGLLPAVNGLHIGVVDRFQDDPEQEFRVKVLLPGIEEGQGAIWARLATPDAGNERGYFFRPEPGDEVVLGFFNDDPRQPVILGALYSSKNRPPAELADLNEENQARAIVTRAGTTIRFTDASKPALLIQTPNQNQIALDDQAEKIEITDQHGNSIAMSKDGIIVKSAKNLTIEASGDVEIKGKKVDVK